MTSLDFAVPRKAFDSPLAVWLACHERLSSACQLLERVLSHHARFGPDESLTSSALFARRYFRDALPRHHADEDTDLFPALRARADAAENTRIDALTRRLEAHHADADALWRPLDDTLARIETGAEARIDLDAARRYLDLHRSHSADEESGLAASLQRLLRPDDWRAIGAGFARRRGTDWTRLARGAA